MTFRDEVSTEWVEGSASADAVPVPAAPSDIAAPGRAPEAARTSATAEAYTGASAKLSGAPSATAAIRSGSPHGGMS